MLPLTGFNFFLHDQPIEILNYAHTGIVCQIKTAIVIYSHKMISSQFIICHCTALSSSVFIPSGHFKHYSNWAKTSSGSLQNTPMVLEEAWPSVNRQQINTAHHGDYNPFHRSDTNTPCLLDWQKSLKTRCMIVNFRRVSKVVIKWNWINPCFDC